MTPLTCISDRIDFERIRPILLDLYDNDTEREVKNNYNPIFMDNNSPESKDEAIHHSNMLQL